LLAEMCVHPLDVEFEILDDISGGGERRTRQLIAFDVSQRVQRESDASKLGWQLCRWPTQASRERRRLQLRRALGVPLLGELLGLRWQDVDLQARRLVVSQQLQRVSTEWVARAPKTKAGRRAVSLDLIGVLRARKTQQNANKLQAGTAWDTSAVNAGLVFTDEIGRHLTIDVLHHALKAALTAAGLPDVRLHDLRHSHASIMLGLGTHPKVMQSRLGHASFAVTMDLYSHVSQSMDEGAADAFGDALRRRAIG
jgi:integrase